MGRSPCCDENGLKKGPWTPEEDQKLVDHIHNHGHGSWRALPKLAGLNRCGKSCRLRWTNYLRPDIKRGKFSPEEEDAILKLHSFLGNKWSAIATHLPGRTDNEIKNFWNTHLKKKLITMGFDPMTHRPRTDFFAALPQLIALASLKEMLVSDASASAARNPTIGTSAASDDDIAMRLHYLQNLLADQQPASAAAEVDDAFGFMNSQMMNSLLPSSFPETQFDNGGTGTTVGAGFDLFGQLQLVEADDANAGISPASLPPLAADFPDGDGGGCWSSFHAGDASSSSSGGAGEVAIAATTSLWPEFLLDDPFVVEFA